MELYARLLFCLFSVNRKICRRSVLNIKCLIILYIIRSKHFLSDEYLDRYEEKWTYLHIQCNFWPISVKTGVTPPYKIYRKSIHIDLLIFMRELLTSIRSSLSMGYSEPIRTKSISPGNFRCPPPPPTDSTTFN